MDLEIERVVLLGLDRVSKVVHQRGWPADSQDAGASIERRAGSTRRYRTVAHDVLASSRCDHVSHRHLEDADAIASIETTDIVIYALVVVVVRQKCMHPVERQNRAVHTTGGFRSRGE
jgi:hypothetical protein